LTQFLQSAQKLLEEIKSHCYKSSHISDNLQEIPSNLEHLRWFVLPSEAVSFIQSRIVTFPTAISPFYPVAYSESLAATLPEIIAKARPKPKHALYPTIPKKND